MKIYDKDYDDNDFEKMMEDTGKMLNQLEFSKKKLEDEFETALKIKLLPKDSSNVSVEEYEAMLEQRNSIVNDTITGLKIIDANINYLKDIGCRLLVETGVMTEEDYLNNKFVNIIMETIDEKNRDLLQISTIANEYNELKLNREVDMIIVIQDTSSYQNIEVQELEDTYNNASEELNHIERILIELNMIKYKLNNDIGVLAHYLAPKENKENDNGKTKKKGKK